MALRAKVALIVIDNFDEIDRLERLIDVGSASGLPDRHAFDADSVQSAHAPTARAAHVRPEPGPHAAQASSKGEETVSHRQGVLIRATPDVRGDTHEKISTGQADSKFGFSMADVPTAIERLQRIDGLVLEGIHAHIGSQLLTLEPFRREAAALAQIGSFPVWDLGGGLGVAYTESQRPPEIEEWVGAVVAAAHAAGIGPHTRLLVEPGRALTANAGVTLYTVESVKRNVSTWVGVDGGMSDNLRPMLYGASYEAHLANRLGNPVAAAGGDATPCVLAGKHCESGDVIVREATLEDPKPGDVVITPATGAYGFAMASNYNGVPRPPVVFCRDGDARVVVRRESFEDLTARDVL